MSARELLQVRFILTVEINQFDLQNQDNGNSQECIFGNS